jgi:hypothetical protein
MFNQFFKLVVSLSTFFECNATSRTDLIILELVDNNVIVKSKICRYFC